MRKVQFGVPDWTVYLLVILPFLAGGFHTCTAALTAVVLILCLIKRIFAEKALRIVINTNTFMVAALAAGYCIAPFWAADKGMAVFGILRCLPLPILALLLMQYTKEDRKLWLSLLPVCGAAMTAIGCMLWAFPMTSAFVTVNGRLSGFLQYPNTFAAFLLTGLAILGAKQRKMPLDWLQGIVLITGMILSGSRTGILLLVFLGLAIAVLYRKLSPVIPLGLIVAGGILLLMILLKGNQITILGRDLGSLLLRILYYKDSIPVIAQHPFGLGYMGYRALEGTFQTSPYTVSFVHSSIVQLLLDIGWIPAAIFVIALGKSLLSPSVSSAEKMVLQVLIGHSLVDFDLEFFLFWSILLLCLDWESGKIFHIRNPKIPAIIAGTASVILCTWLGLGDFLCQIGDFENALAVTPFHTDALTAKIKTTADTGELDRLGDKILSLNPTHSLAYSAKANAAFSRGAVMDMILYKEKAIQCAPFVVEEYCDYIEKLYIVMERFVEAGDHSSAVYCLEKILSIPEEIEETAAKTDPLAFHTGNSAELRLPDGYLKLVAALSEANSQ